MGYTGDELTSIYERTSGYCHICRKKLAFKNYGRFGERGAWEVEHSNPRVRGGTNCASNLYAACVSCNRRKRDSATRTARSDYGYRKAPLSSAERKKARIENAVAGGVAGAVVGSIFGPGGALVGSVIGARIGHKSNPDKDRA
jgi:hypothetical protein